MSDQQIHELPELDPADFEPSVDKFIMQSDSTEDLGTYSATFSNMINQGSAELPGSTDWQWNFLSSPVVIQDYLFGPNEEVTSNKARQSPFTPDPIDITDIPIPSTDQNNSLTSLPVTAQNFLCVAAIRNASLSFWAPRGQVLISTPEAVRKSTILNRETARSYGSWRASSLDNAYEGPVKESIFVVENISWIRDSKIDINSAEEPVYRDSGKLHFSIQPRTSKILSIRID